MGAQMNIKSEEAYQLASKIAKAEGISLTQAVVEALRMREREISQEVRFAKAMELCRDARALMSPETLALDIDDYLYDEYGLPK
ncbi:type II toxin-antitoxin system VapB family antitoxin [Blastomonas sp.]|uniref:type II toxin-antitoxin system VapB family antitoxin n=1 Tax=Blastomonas sp. TaxID=1909299 RepID=UPI003593FA5F